MNSTTTVTCKDRLSRLGCGIFEIRNLSLLRPLCVVTLPIYSSLSHHPGIPFCLSISKKNSACHDNEDNVVVVLLELTSIVSISLEPHHTIVDVNRASHTR